MRSEYRFCAAASTLIGRSATVKSGANGGDERFEPWCRLPASGASQMMEHLAAQAEGDLQLRAHSRGRSIANVGGAHPVDTRANSERELIQLQRFFQAISENFVQASQVEDLAFFFTAVYGQRAAGALQDVQAAWLVEVNAGDVQASVAR